MALHNKIEPGMAIDLGDDITVLLSRTKSGYRVSIEAPQSRKISFRSQTKAERGKMTRRRKTLTKRTKS